MQAKNKIYQTSIIFVLIIAGLIGFVIYPIWKNIQKNSQQITLDKIEIISMEAESKQLSAFEKDYSAYKPNLEKIDRLFINAENPIDFIRFLESVALGSGITANINLVPLPKNENSAKLIATSFRIYAQGNFSDILTFAEKLETGDYLVVINSLTIRKSDKNIDASKNIANIVEADFAIEALNR